MVFYGRYQTSAVRLFSDLFCRCEAVYCEVSLSWIDCSYHFTRSSVVICEGFRDRLISEMPSSVSSFRDRMTLLSRCEAVR
jgi:hypothetical protein